MTQFTMATLDEVWFHGELREIRFSAGSLLGDGLEREGRSVDLPEWRSLLERRLRPAQDFARSLTDGGVHIVESSRRIGNRTIQEDLSIVTLQGVSLVSTVAHLAADVRLLRAMLDEPVVAAELKHALPILWSRGSAAVLLHEAVGHAAEHNRFGLLPEWLTVRDQPVREFDDDGYPTAAADLILESPRSIRRPSYREVGRARMSNVVVRQYAAPFVCPPERIEVSLVEGGSYDPLTEMVQLRIVIAHHVTPDARSRIPPFVFRKSREQVLESLCGAEGEPLRYPGVICSLEGEELFVGSYAPLVLSE